MTTLHIKILTKLSTKTSFKISFNKITHSHDFYNKFSIFTYIFRTSFNFQTSNIRSNQNKIFKNRVFVKILQFSKKYEFNKTKSIDYSIVFKISIFCFFIDENFFFVNEFFFRFF